MNNCLKITPEPVSYVLRFKKLETGEVYETTVEALLPNDALLVALGKSTQPSEGYNPVGELQGLLHTVGAMQWKPPEQKVQLLSIEPVGESGNIDRFID